MVILLVKLTRGALEATDFKLKLHRCRYISRARTVKPVRRAAADTTDRGPCPWPALHGTIGGWQTPASLDTSMLGTYAGARSVTTAVELCRGCGVLSWRARWPDVYRRW